MSKITYEPNHYGVKEVTPGHFNLKSSIFVSSLLLITIVFVIASIMDGAFDGDWYELGAGVCGVIWFSGIILLPEWADNYFPYTFSKYDYDKYKINHFDPKNMNNIIYKKAFDDCVEEIKNGDFVSEAWSKIFQDLNIEIDRIKSLEKQQKIAIDRLDYAKVLKDANKLYLGE